MVIKDHYERTVKIANYLLVAQSAGFVGCLSLIKDYKQVSTEVPQLKGLGYFIALFGIGLILAIVYFAIATFFIMKAADKVEIKVTKGGSKLYYSSLPRSRPQPRDARCRGGSD